MNWTLPPGGTQHLLDEFVGTAPDMERAMRHAQGRQVVVQAGGNVGVWPAWLADKFRWVYTFEPEPQCFAALARNVPQTNVFKFCAALGDRRGGVSLHLNETNIGGNVIRPEPGPIPLIRLDDLVLQTCDLVVLDVEGYEMPALLGALDTIDHCKPVLMIEDRGHGERYGRGSFSEITAMLGRRGYREVDRVHHDAIFAQAGAAW